jgi:superfamily II DNA or RNA helicase
VTQLSLIADDFEDWFFREDPPVLKRGQYQPRWYQDECHEAILTALQDNRSCLAVLATGLGKTQIFCALARDWTDGDVLVVAHRDELIDQARARLELITGEEVELEQGEWKSGRARIVVSSAQTISKPARLERLGKDRFGLCIFDECFPAGTLVDGVPIEKIRTGDHVMSVDHKKGRLVRSRIKQAFSRISNEFIVIRSGATTLRCTPNHPIFVQRGGACGYVKAKDVASGDMLCVWEGIHAARGERSAPTEDLLEPVSVRDLFSCDGSDEPPLCIRANDQAQPDEASGDSQEGVGHAQGKWASTKRTWRKRARPYETPEASGRYSGLADGGSGLHRHEAWQRLSRQLQTRHWESVIEDRNRGGWLISRFLGSSSTGCEKGQLLAWARVDSVSRDEPTGTRGEFVYNLEVEGSHTYFANGVLTHNCHHYPSKTWRRPFDYFQAKVVGVTATPDRGDSKALGKLFDTVAYVYDIADGIDDGWLVPIIGKTVEAKEIDLSRVSASKGDLEIGELDEAMLQAAEHICQETLKLCPDRQGIMFWPGVRSAELAMYKMNALRPDSCAFVHGGTEPTERKQLMEDYRRGRYQWLSNCMIATEGFDAPTTSCIVFGRPTKSRSLAAQMAGRGTRVLPGVVDAFPAKEQAFERLRAISSSAKPDMMLLDFVGNAGRHKGLLVTPTDILGGNYSEAEVKMAKKAAQREGGGDVAAQLKKAREELRRMASEYRAHVKSKIENWDPFGFVGFKLENEQKYADFGAEPLTDKQYAALKRMGFPENQLDSMSKRQGIRLFNHMSKRREKGLCSMGKANQLRKHGIDPSRVREDDAVRAMDYLAATGWGKGTNPAELNAIAFGQRSPGVD